MKKLNTFKVLFAATALAIALVGCGDLGEESPAQTQVTKDGKVGVSLSVKEDFRTLVSDVDTANLSYELVISDTADSNAEDYEAARVISLDSLDSSATVAYLTAGKNYSFALTGYKTIEGEKTPIIASRNAVKKTISADDAKVSIMLVALSGSKVNVSLTVSYASSYGVSDLAASVFTDGALTNVASDSLSLDSENEENSDKSDGKVVFTGEIETGSTRWVKIELKDGERTIGGKTLALYGIPTGDISGQVEASVKEYKACIKLTADTKPESLLLKNKEISKSDYTGISLTTESAEKPYIFTGYVPVGEYDVYNGETVIGQVTNTTALEVNTSVSLTGLSATWTESQPRFFAGSEGNDEAIKNALTVKATMSNCEEVISNYTIDYDNESTAEQELLVSYTYNGVRKTATVSLKLTEVVLESIAVKTAPEKVTYTEGEELDLSGLVLNLFYNDVRKNAEVEYVKPDTESGESGNAEDFNITLYSDSECTTEVSEAFTELAATTYYVKVTYAELMTEAFSVKISSGSTYILKAKTAAISLMKSEFGTIADTAQEGGKAYLTAATDNWNSSEQTLTVDEITYEGFPYNLGNSSRVLTIKTKAVAAFKVYVKNNTKGRKYDVSLGETLLGTETHQGDNVESSALYYTNTTDEITIKLAGNSGSVYPICIVLYSEEGIKELLKADFEELAGTVSEISAADYWTGYETIVTARDVNTENFVASDYSNAIKELKGAISTAVKYTKPQSITVKNGDVIVENGGVVSFAKAISDILTLTAFENEGSTGSLTWNVSGIEGVSSNVTVADGISTCVISGIENAGTIAVTVSDEDERTKDAEGHVLSTSFTIDVSADVVKVAADDVITVESNADTVEVASELELNAKSDKSYSEAVEYQWYKNNVEIANATSATYLYEPTADDIGTVSFKVSVKGSEAEVVSPVKEITVTLTDFTELFAKYGTSATAITETKAITCSAETRYYFQSGISFNATGSDKFAANAVEIPLSDSEKVSATNRIELAKAASGASAPVVNIPVAADCKITVLWYCNGTSERGPYLKSTKGSFTAASGSTTNGVSAEKKAAWSTAKTKIYSASVFKYEGEADSIALTNSKSDGTAGGGTLYLYGVIVSYDANVSTTPDPNTTVVIGHDIPTDDISLSVNGSTVSVTLPSGVSDSASYEWLVDGYKQPDQASASFALSKVYYRNGDSDEEQTILPGQTFIVTARVTIGGLVYTKTTSLLYTGN